MPCDQVDERGRKGSEDEVAETSRRHFVTKTEPKTQPHKTSTCGLLTNDRETTGVTRW